MCVMLWANGAVLLKRLVHSSNIERLVVLAEKKSLWTVSVRGPNFDVSNILFLGFLSWFIQPSACCEDSFTSTYKQLCVMVAYEKFVQYLIHCVWQFCTIPRSSWASCPWEGLVELLLWSSGYSFAWSMWLWWAIEVLDPEETSSLVRKMSSVYEELEDGSSGVKHIWSLDVLAV